MNRGKVHGALQKNYKYLKNYTTALKNDSDNANAYFVRGNAYCNVFEKSFNLRLIILTKVK